jgi:hypothetical protein
MSLEPSASRGTITSGEVAMTATSNHRAILSTALTLIVLGVLVLSTVNALTAASSVRRVPPPGWFAAGSHPNDYDMGIDTAVKRADKPSVRLTSIVPTPGGFGTMMQVIAADAYRGKRVRLAGDLRVRDVASWASLWMRVDGPCSRSRAFDNAQGRAARGTADWQRMEVVLDVAPDAQGIFFGVLLTGAGTVWVSGLRFEIVPTTVATTAPSIHDARRCGPSAPVNLDFTEMAG